MHNVANEEYIYIYLGKDNRCTMSIQISIASIRHDDLTNLLTMGNECVNRVCLQ